MGKSSWNQLYLTDFTKFFAQVSPTIISEKQLAIFVVLRQIREPILIILLYNWHLMLLFLLILMRLCRFFWTVLSQTIIFLFAYKIEKKKDHSLRSLQKYAGSNYRKYLLLITHKVEINQRILSKKWVHITVWKLQNFSVTQIFREINFEKSGSSKIAVFAILGIWILLIC